MWPTFGSNLGNVSQHCEKIKPRQRFKVYDTFMLRAILGSDSTDSQEDAAASVAITGASGGSTKGTSSHSTAASSSRASASSGARLASSFCRSGCSRSISSSAVLNNSPLASNYDYGTPATVAPSTSTIQSPGNSGCLACEVDKLQQQSQYHYHTEGERKSRRSFATRSSCSKMSHSSSSSLRGSSRGCVTSNSKSVSPGSYSCNALNVDFSTYTATHQWTKMLECAEFVGAK